MITIHSSSSFEHDGGVSQHSGFNDGVYHGDIHLNQLHEPKSEAITTQHRGGYQTEGTAYVGSATTTQHRGGYQTEETAYVGSANDTPGIETSQSYPSSKTCCRPNTGFTIFKRVLSALLIIGDLLIDWSSLADVITGTVSDEHSLKENKIFTFSFPSMDATCAVLNGNGTINNTCGSSTYTLTVSYGGSVVFGSLFAVIKLLNIIGETIREVDKAKQKHQNRDKGEDERKKKKRKTLKGFQLLHGWVETFFALFFEDLPENFLVLLYANTCKRKALNKTKTMVTMLGSLMKNVVRKFTCKQQKKSACKCCHYSIDIGCSCCTCLSCILCSCCIPIKNLYPEGSLVNGKEGRKKIEDMNGTCECCTCVHLNWGWEVDCPPMWSCGRCIIIDQTGLCIEKGTCCEWEKYHGCCGKTIDKDPLWLEKYIVVGYLANIAIVILYLIRCNLASPFGL